MLKKPPIKHPNLLEIFLIILKTSFFTLGGGILIIFELKKILVDNKKIISEKTFDEIFSASNAIPGATIINFSFLLGKKLGSLYYSILFIIAGLVPSILIITLIATYISFDFKNIYFKKFLMGSKISSATVILIITINFFYKTIKKSLAKQIVCILVIYLLYQMVDLFYILFIFFIIYIIKYKFRKREGRIWF